MLVFLCHQLGSHSDLVLLSNCSYGWYEYQQGTISELGHGKYSKYELNVWIELAFHYPCYHFCLKSVLHCCKRISETDILYYKS
jgi:hypothetical protein